MGRPFPELQERGHANARAQAADMAAIFRGGFALPARVRYADRWPER